MICDIYIYIYALLGIRLHFSDGGRRQGLPRAFGGSRLRAWVEDFRAVGSLAYV